MWLGIDAFEMAWFRSQRGRKTGLIFPAIEAASMPVSHSKSYSEWRGSRLRRVAKATGGITRVRDAVRIPEAWNDCTASI